MKKLGVLCQSCGIEAPCRQVTFHQNIGMLVARRYKTVKGYLCHNCISKNFWQITGTTLAIGWLGTISLILTPIFITNNIIQYLGSLGLAKVPADAKVPIVDNRVSQAVFPKYREVIERLNAGQDFNDVARDISAQIGVTPGEVQAYVRAMIRSQRASAAPKAVGFPVIQNPPPLPPAT